MPSKSELEADYRVYCDVLEAVRKDWRLLFLFESLDRALRHLSLTIPATTYRCNHLKEDGCAHELFSFLCLNGPVVFAAGILDASEAWLANNRRVISRYDFDFQGLLADARERLTLARLVWNWIEQAGEAEVAELVAAMQQAKPVTDLLALWAELEIIESRGGGTGGTMRLVTSFGRLTNGKCLHCGALVEAPKELMFEQFECPQCRCARDFALI